MISSSGPWPAAGLVLHFLEKQASIAGIAVGVEGCIQRGEGCWMVEEIDLKAADINGLYALLLEGFYSLYRFLA